MASRERIAIIGAGISGLTAAYKLSAENDVTVFEAEPRIGGHSNTFTVETAAGPLPVDTGFIVYNDRNYPNFERLLKQIDVPTKASDMSFSVSDLDGKFEYGGGSPYALFATRSNAVNPRFYAMVKDLLRFNREGRRLLAADDPALDLSLRDFLEVDGYGSYFVERLIVPQASAVWSADPAQMWSFPVRFIFEFFANHGMLGTTARPNWRTIDGGSRQYVERLARSFADRINTGTPVTSVTRHWDRVVVGYRGGEQSFDQVVFATHSDRSLAMLANPTPAEREVLGAMEYLDNEVVLHTDSSLLPNRKAARASWNYHWLQQPKDRSTVTYWMNRLQSIDSRTNYCVTLNMTEHIDPRQTLATFQYEHPVFSTASVAAQKRHHEISGVNRTYYCGAYWRWGFHEDGVWSALRACAQLTAAHSELVIA